MATTPTKKAPAKKVASGRPAGLFTWLAVGLVVLVVAGLVIIKVASGSTGATSSAFQATDATTAGEVTGIPASVFDTVGVTSSVAPVTAPQVLKSQPLLTGTSSTGTSVPQVLYVGAEYCPFCAAERWATIAALSRFGTWSGLGNTESSTLSGEVYPGTQTFTFLKAKFVSKYISFAGVEVRNNVFNATLQNYSPLQTPTKTQAALLAKYDTSKYITGMTAAQNGSIPFIDFGNQFLVSGASYSPAALQNLTRTQIASGLSDPTNPITQAIVATANEQVAAICSLTKQQPATVCNAAGTKAGKKALGLK